MDGGGSSPAEGDRALAALLRFHGVAMNGGLLHAIEFRSTDEVRDAIAGYRYFGLESAASVVEWLQREAAEVDLDADLDSAERLEIEADQRYGTVVPDDATLVSAFEARISEHPEAFASL